MDDEQKKLLEEKVKYLRKLVADQKAARDMSLEVLNHEIERQYRLRYLAAIKTGAFIGASMALNNLGFDGNKNMELELKALSSFNEFKNYLNAIGPGCVIANIGIISSALEYFKRNKNIRQAIISKNEISKHDPEEYYEQELKLTKHLDHYTENES